MDCYFRQYWRDQRLSFKGLKNNANNLVINQLSLNVAMLEKIWKPDTYFHNGLDSYLHSITRYDLIKKIALMFQKYSKNDKLLYFPQTMKFHLTLFPSTSSDSSRNHASNKGKTAWDVKLATPLVGNRVKKKTKQIKIYNNWLQKNYTVDSEKCKEMCSNKIKCCKLWYFTILSINSLCEIFCYVVQAPYFITY